MDFKSYVKLMLEAEKDEDQDKKKAKDEDDDEESEDEDDDEEESKASVKTKNSCTGSEASDKTEDDDEDDEDDDEDDDDEDEDEDDDDEKSPSLKEAMLYSVGYGSSHSVITEETRVLLEGIKNNSASKYLSKLSKKAEKEAARYTKKGTKEAAATAKKAAYSLKEASSKLYKYETRYQAGDVTAKKEYKQICKQYSKELKNMGRGARGFRNLLFTILAGAVLLGGIGLTAVANDDIIDKLNSGFQNKEKMPEILKGLALNDKNAIEDLVKSAKDGSKEGFDGVKKGVKDALGRATEHANDKYFGKDGKATDWATQKKDWAAQKEGWKDAAEKYHYENDTPLAKGVKKAKETGENIVKGVKSAADNSKKAIKGAF